MILLAILTGGIVALIWARQTKWYELLILGGWGLLAAGTALGAPITGVLMQANGFLAGWFS